jgi:hypothetical protein
MEKHGLEQAVMILGAGAFMLQIARNISLVFVKNNKKNSEAASRKNNFSNTLNAISTWTVRTVMSLILIGNSYQLFFSGVEAGKFVYCIGIAGACFYFVFTAGISAKRTDGQRHAATVLSK